MNSIKAVFLIATIIMVSMLSQAEALQQTSAQLNYVLKLGETQTLQWGLISDEDIPTTLELYAEGPGSELLSFPSSIDLNPHELTWINFTVNIPEDYQNNVELRPAIFALQKSLFKEESSGAMINIQMKKIVSIEIGDAPEYEDVIPEPQTPTIDPEPQEQPKQPETTTFIIEPDTKNKEGGGCLIATAAYGSELSSQVQQLRELRDGQLLQTDSGTSFMAGFNQFYYSFSPTVADWERENPAFKEFVKISLTPMISSLSILNYVDMDSEDKVLGYGISLIILNGMMYVGLPIIGIISLRKVIN